VRVIWLKDPSPLGYGHIKGSGSKVRKEEVEKLVAGGYAKVVQQPPVERPPVVKDTMVRKKRTRPVSRAKDS